MPFDGTHAGLREPSPPHGVPVAVPYAGSSPPGGVAAAPRVSALPFDAQPGAPPGPLPANPFRPAYPGYSYAVPLPVPLGDDARYLRPGFAVPRGASGLTTTHVIARRERGWLVSLIAAVVVLAAATAVIVAVGSGRAAARESSPPALRVAPDPAPP